MTTALADWIRTLTGAAIFCAIAFAICPRGRPRQVLSLACGCVMAVALLSPVAGLDVTSLARAAAAITRPPARRSAMRRRPHADSNAQS